MTAHTYLHVPERRSLGQSIGSSEVIVHYRHMSQAQHPSQHLPATIRTRRFLSPPLFSRHEVFDAPPDLDSVVDSRLTERRETVLL